MNKVNPKKLLPESVSKKRASLSQKLLVPASKVTTKDYAKVDDSTATPQQKQLNQQTIKLKKKFISLTKLFGEKTTLEKKRTKRKRIEAEQENREKREEEKEGSNTKFDFGSKLPKLNLPRTGFLDTIKRFLLYGLLGFAIDKFGPMIPDLLGMLIKLKPAFEFFKNVVVGMVGGIVNFIDRSYKAYDFVKGKIKEIIGPDRSEEFDNFTKALKGVINGTLIAAAAIVGLDAAKGPLGRGSGSRGGRVSPGAALGDATNRRRLSATNRRNRFVNFNFRGKTKRISQSSAKYLNSLIASGDLRSANEFFANPSKYQSQVRTFIGQNIDSSIAAPKQLTPENLTRSRGSGVPKVSPTAARTPGKLRGFARGGVRGLSKGPLKALVGPFIGGIIDFVVSMLFGDPVGEAAAGAVGAAVLGAVGGFLGNFVLPIGGGFIGATVGGFAGDALFREIYKSLLNIRASEEEQRRTTKVDPSDSDTPAYTPGVTTSPGKAIVQSERETGELRFDPVITGRYGDVRSTGRHGGTDIAAPTGTPLVPVTDAVVVDYGDLGRSDAKRGDPSGWGNFVVYKDARGYYHLYGHLSEIVKRSGSVRKGEIIARVGNTGRSSGPHLHWEIGTGWTGGMMTGKMDPLSFYTATAPFRMSKKQASLGNKTVNVASGLNDTAGYEDDQTIAFVQPVVERVQTPAPASGGGSIVLNSNNTPSIFAPALVG